VKRTAVAVLLGVAGALALAGLYLGTVTWAEGADHALELLREDRLFVGAISLGFGTQVGLFSYVRMLRRAMAGTTVALTGAGTATSSVSMVACCAHHLADVLPLVGLAGAALFLSGYQVLFLLAGVLSNVVGIAFLLGEMQKHSLYARDGGVLAPLLRWPVRRAVP